MDFFDIFKNLTVGEVWPTRKSVVTFNVHTSVKHCLQEMEQISIRAAPVLKEDGSLAGIVDVNDIALFIIGMFPKGNKESYFLPI